MDIACKVSVIDGNAQRLDGKRTFEFILCGFGGAASIVEVVPDSACGTEAEDKRHT